MPNATRDGKPAPQARLAGVPLSAPSTRGATDTFTRTAPLLA
jgi:hypothetical protein